MKQKIPIREFRHKQMMLFTIRCSNYCAMMGEHYTEKWFRIRDSLLKRYEKVSNRDIDKYIEDHKYTLNMLGGE